MGPLSFVDTEIQLFGLRGCWLCTAYRRMRSLLDILDMHVHVCQFLVMRTTIELGNDKRAKLLELAARRGEKGFSRIVDEALSAYFESLSKRDQQVRAALSAIGSLQDIEADRLEDEVEKIRRSWR
jgi:hypothetical protein